MPAASRMAVGPDRVKATWGPSAWAETPTATLLTLAFELQLPNDTTGAKGAFTLG